MEDLKSEKYGMGLHFGHLWHTYQSSYQIKKTVSILLISQSEFKITNTKVNVYVLFDISDTDRLKKRAFVEPALLEANQIMP